MVSASWLQGISWRTKANQKGKNILNEWYSVGSRGGAKAPSLFLDQTKIRRAEKKNSGDRTPPPPPFPPYPALSQGLDQTLMKINYKFL